MNDSLPWFFAAGLVSSGGEINLDSDEIHHAKNVLRLKEGSPLILCNGQGLLAEATISQLNHRTFAVRYSSAVSVERQYRIHLAFAVPRPAALEVLIRKSTELGVSALQPLFTLQSFSAKEFNSGRWEKVIREAGKQSQNPIFPRLMPPLTLEAWLKSERSGHELVVCSESQRDRKVQIRPDTLAIDLLIGAEGGWHSSELKSFTEYKALPLGLGPNRLRAETAALAAITLMKNVLGEL